MKKAIKLFILMLSVLSVLSLPLYSTHVHAYEKGEVIGSCPECGRDLIWIDTIKEATCTEAGSGTAACEDETCGYQVEMELPALGHDFSIELSEDPATCTAEGTKYFVCSRCGETKTEAIPAIGHSYIETITKEPSCTSKGLKTFTCEHCSDTYTEEIDATGHDYESAITKEATCTVDGLRTYNCQKCKNSYTETIPALGHNYDRETIVEATCTKAGSKTFICSRCAHQYSEEIPALGHNYESEILEKATCEEEGKKQFICTRCRDQYTEVIEALGHSYQETITKEPTCTEAGEKKFVCENCFDEHTEEIPPLNHAYGEFEVVKQATCEEKGKQVSECSRCHEKITQDIDELGHDYSANWVIEKEAGLFTKGLRSKTCSRCMKKVEDKIPAKIGLPILIAVGLPVIALITYAVLWIVKKLKEPKAPKVHKVHKKGAFKPRFEINTIVVCSNDLKFINTLKYQRYLDVVETDMAELIDAIEDYKPDLVICDTLDDERLVDVIELMREYPKTKYALRINKNTNYSMLKMLEGEREGKLVNYIVADDKNYAAYVSLILPILKDDLGNCTTLKHIATLCNHMYIPDVPEVIDAYLAGKDIKDVMLAGELSVVEKAAVIENIISILDLKDAEGAADLINKVDTLKVIYQ